NEQDIDSGVRQTLNISANLLKFPECLPAPLIFKDRVRQFERMLDAIRINLRTQPLRNDVDVVVLEVFGYTGHKGCANSQKKKNPHAPKKLARRVLRVSSGVVIDDVPENDRIQQGKNLVDCCENENPDDQ